MNGTLPDNWNGIDHTAEPASLPQFEKLRTYQPDKPLMSGEAWTGSIQFWGRKFKKGGNGEKMAAYFREALKMGVCVNFYMFCGGTNFGFMNGALYSVGSKKGYAPLMTSYDYNGPVSEEGAPTEKYFALRDVLDEFLGKEKRPHVDPFGYEAQAVPAFRLTEAAPLFENLDALSEKRATCNRTVSMEDLDQDYGLICYRSKLRYTDPRVRHLHIDGLADRATVYIDGTYIGTVMRDEEQNPDITFTVKEGGSELTILVENMGRVNYGDQLRDRKGVGAVRLGYLGRQHQFGWDIYSLPMEKELENLQFLPAKEPCYQGPTFLRGKLTLTDAPCDTFLRLDGFHKGFVKINGFNLGRYFNDAGPQRTLYVPAPILKQGENEILVFESDGTDTLTVTFTDTPDLG
jgi:beta-galactosidase